MIPKLEDINIGEEIEIVEQPTFTYRFNFETGEITGYKDGKEAMEQAIYKILETERYKYEIYDWDYGFEVSDLFGKPKPYVYSELKRRIREALLDDDRILEVDNFIFETSEKDVVHTRFTVHTIFGDIDGLKEVNV
ncbi:DUF2634 domain-containing protein [Tissierella sp. MSJ-40]|uniref:DUF2634 domain-containing protein n=1 Tax=Tissierella simiarum TaxID=2841534 RepID=A0ABS6E0F2_9FIRM|nr:DUF2634 domain-containing protein [Tissierella simiarum]MBU5436378.1 DUF2634 domain-containing protein [Tissierella simiarum]